MKVNTWLWLLAWALLTEESMSMGLPRVMRTTVSDIDLSDLNVSSSESSKSWWSEWLYSLAKPMHKIRELKERLKVEWRPKLGRDPIELAGLPEGDILPNPNVGIDKKSGVQDKNAVIETTRLWPDGIVPYQFSAEFLFLPLERYMIKQVMADIGQHSCTRFVERTDESDFIKFIYDRDKCYSHIGRVGGPQSLSLGFFCVKWWDRGTIYHELLHSLGFFHEHNRPDRDNYVEILWDNISSGQDKNFRKRSYSTVELTDLPYDIDSVMHYSPFAFSKWYFLAPTIKSRSKGVFFKRSKKPSSTDYDKLNRLYGCQRDGRFLLSRLEHVRSRSRWAHEKDNNIAAVVSKKPSNSSLHKMHFVSQRHRSRAIGRQGNRFYQQMRLPRSYGRHENLPSIASRSLRASMHAARPRGYQRIRESTATDVTAETAIQTGIMSFKT